MDEDEVIDTKVWFLFIVLSFALPILNILIG